MSLYGGIDLHANNTDFSVVLFRPNFMLASEQNHVKVLKKQWVLSRP